MIVLVSMGPREVYLFNQDVEGILEDGNVML